MEINSTHFQNPLFADESILQLIPQRPPMVMVERFYGVEGETSFSGLTVRAENIFCQDERLLEEGIIEHFAQSAAARIGYLFLQKNEAVPIGFIGAVSKFTLHSLPQVNDELTTAVTVIQEVGNITLAGVKSWVGEVLIAEGELKIYLNK